MISEIKLQAYTNKFLKRAKEKHGERFDYSKVVYVNTNTRVIIKCNECQTEFEVTPNGHLKNGGCRHCGSKKRGENQSKKFIDNLESELRAVHGYKFDYRFSLDNSSIGKIEIYCKEHNVTFYQRKAEHLNGHGCPQCSYEAKTKKLRKKIPFINTIEELQKWSIEKFGDKYSYEKVTSFNLRDIIEIYCKRCKKYFKQRLYNHLHGASCKHCHYREVGFNNLVTKEIVLQKIATIHNNQFELIECKDVLTSKKDRITIKCKDCGNTFSILYSNLRIRNRKKTICKNCIELSYTKELNYSFTYYDNSESLRVKRDWIVKDYLLSNNLPENHVHYGVIYRFTNLINNKVYIGLSTNFSHRIITHIIDSRRNNKNRKSMHLYSAISKYGWGNFKIEIVDIAYSKEELSEKENMWALKHNSYDIAFGYNIANCGDHVGGIDSTKLTKEELKKYRILQRTKIRSHWLYIKDLDLLFYSMSHYARFLLNDWGTKHSISNYVTMNPNIFKNHKNIERYKKEKHGEKSFCTLFI